MNDIFRIETPGVELEEVLARVRERVADRRRDEIPDGFAAAQEAAVKIAPLKTGEKVLDFYLESIVEAARIDINDFEIPGADTWLGHWEIRLKRVIWKLMKFYTYRLFSQQNDFNGRVALILEGMNRKYSRRLEKLNAKVRSLEAQRPA